ncbi:MAG TPA: aromatic ring-hydroxylating dioxygenase subunit alpha [Hyphomicrobiales bacterium]|nr:aromatic ring-hydroxylating dioxygenase subunit alpha [Hyphomicrobiales bacterium]
MSKAGVREGIDEGTAYGRPPQHSNPVLTQVGPGTPLGELMRRYWQPVAMSEEVTTTPKQIRILGEDFVIFRDRKGRPGMLYPRCMHRGTTLYYGKVEDEGIRCCYHGWLFDVEGHCLDQPCEPSQGEGHREKVRQPWYPVEERYGLMFAYMGPAEKKPVLPHWDNIENLGPDEEYQTRYANHIGNPILDYSWLHQNDNVMDPFHVQVLHSTFTGAQFHPQFALMPKVDFKQVEDGVYYSAVRVLDDGRTMDRISHWMCPNVMAVPSTQMDAGAATGVAWVVPVDDTHYFQLLTRRVKKGAPNLFLKINGKALDERSEAERREFPGDYEAQIGQGPISLHTEEHLATSDRGIVMQRRFLERQMKVVAEGGDPVGVSFDPKKATVKVRSGNFFSTAQAAE